MTGAAAVEAALRALIGELPAGSALPPAPELAARLGAGTTTVWMALRPLRAAGLITGVTGVGTFVAGPRTGTAGAVEAGLRARMASGDLPPGTPLPAATVAAGYGVSAETARKALGALRAAGLVTMPPGRAMLVTGGTGRPWAPPAAGPEPAIGPVAERHLDHMRQQGLAAGTIYGRRRFLVRLAAVLPVPPAVATRADVEAWRAGLDVTPDAVYNLCTHAREFYGWLAGQGIRDDNPAARLPVPRRRKRLPRPISEADLMTVLDAAPPRIRLWLVLAAWAGLRACEIAGLRRENVMEAAGAPVLIVAEDATKGTRERAVPLSEFVVAELAAYGLPRAGYVFGRLDGQPGPNTPGRVSGVANDHLHACGVPATLHSMRHRFGTQAYRGSKDLLAVQALMGHASPVTTAGYAAFDNAEAIAAVASIPAPAPRPRLRAVAG